MSTLILALIIMAVSAAEMILGLTSHSFTFWSSMTGWSLALTGHIALLGWWSMARDRRQR
jgi:hypothetical protein